MLVKGRSYATGPLSSIRLEVARRVKDEFGFGWGHVMAYIRALKLESTIADLVADDEFIAWMWAWMLNAGDDITLDEFRALTLEDLAFAKEKPADDESGDPADPPPASDPAATAPGTDAPVSPAAKWTSTKTPRKRSTHASR